MKRKIQILFRKLSLVIATIFMVTAVWAQQSISGTVVDEGGQPLPGVSVIIQGTATGTVTGADGKFSLTVPADGVLEFSFVFASTENFSFLDSCESADSIEASFTTSDKSFCSSNIAGMHTQNEF